MKMSEEIKIKRLLGELIDKGLSFEVRCNCDLFNLYTLKIIDEDISQKKVIWLVKKGFEMEGGAFIINFEFQQIRGGKK